MKRAYEAVSMILPPEQFQKLGWRKVFVHVDDYAPLEERLSKSYVSVESGEYQNDAGMRKFMSEWKYSPAAAYRTLRSMLGDNFVKLGWPLIPPSPST